MRILSAIVASSLIVSGCVGQAPPTPAGCEGKRNDKPVLDITPQPLKTVPNGQSWLMKQDEDWVYIGKIKGTAYEMGHAYGELFADYLKQQYVNAELMYPDVSHDMLEDLGVPKAYLDLLSRDQFFQLTNIALDVNWKVASPYIPQRFVDEIRGIADGSGIDEARVRRANMLGELTQAHCTVMGVWKNAGLDGKLLHFRGLDWEAFAPINQFPGVIFYEPTEEGSHPFANIGYLGLIGSLTAISKIGISAGEKVMIINNPSAYPKDPQITYFGKPWMMVLRDGVQFANNMADVQRMLNEADRTMKIHGGWASLPDNLFRGMDYAANFVDFYDDHNYTHYNQVDHPELDGIFFLNKHVQPSDDRCMASIITEQYGRITAETIYRDIAGYQATGTNNVVVMDPAGQQIWVSWS